MDDVTQTYLPAPIRPIRQVAESATADSYVIQANNLARSKYSDAANVHAMRLIIVAIAKVDRDQDMLGQITITNREIRDIFTRSYGQTNRLGEYVSTAADRMMGLRVEMYERDGSWEKANLILNTSYKARPGVLSITFHPDVRSYLLRLSGSYTKYQLRAIAKLSNGYQLHLFQFMRSYVHHGGINLTTSDLRHLLGVPDGTYGRLYDLQKRVLDPAVKAINNESDIFMSYTIAPQRQGDSVFRFKVTAKQIGESIFDRAAHKMLTQAGVSETAALRAITDRGCMTCIRLLALVRHQVTARSAQKGRAIRDKGAYLAKVLTDGMLPAGEQQAGDLQETKDRKRAENHCLAEFRQHCFEEYPADEQKHWLDEFGRTLNDKLKFDFDRFGGQLLSRDLEVAFNQFLARHLSPSTPNLKLSF